MNRTLTLLSKTIQSLGNIVSARTVSAYRSTLLRIMMVILDHNPSVECQAPLALWAYGSNSSCLKQTVFKLDKYEADSETFASHPV